jgi:hypothetical protein
MNSYKEFYNKNKDLFDIYIVYILEAHFVEKDENTGKILGGWPIGNQYNFPQHKTIQQRIEMSKILQIEFDINIPIFIDHIDNDFQNYHKIWPDGAIVYKDNKLLYKSRIGDDGSRKKIWTQEILEIIG